MGTVKICLVATHERAVGGARIREDGRNELLV
jgi:hypothetical protein